MFRIFKQLMRDENGATAIEYGLIAALVAVAAVGAMTTVGTNLSTTFNNVATKLYNERTLGRQRCGGRPRAALHILARLMPGRLCHHRMRAASSGAPKRRRKASASLSTRKATWTRIKSGVAEDVSNLITSQRF